jgi:tetratricopeptide (TPR) repeat protein
MGRSQRGYRRRVTPRARVSAAVAAAAVAAAGITVLATALTATDTTPAESAAAQPGAPPLVLDLGVRTDAEARALRRAAVLYERKRRAAAAAIFDRYASVEARVGSALARWPDGFRDLDLLARTHPADGAALLNLGLGLYWRGQLADARAAWRQAKDAEPNSEYAIRAGDLLHPTDPVPGLPTYVAGFPPPPLQGLAPPAQLARLRRAASSGGAREKILYGIALQRLGRPVSAERAFQAAAAAAPDDPEALTARAVGRFDKDDPSRAFSVLGPLARRFPKAATVRFHLGLLLVWLGQVDGARRQFTLAIKAEPGSVHARQAAAFLAKLPAG